MAGSARSSMGWIAIVTATAFLNGCCMRPMAPVGGPPQTWSDAGSGTYQDGVRDGEGDAERDVAGVAGYFLLGTITAPLLVLCVLAAAASGSPGGGNFGNCSGGGSIETHSHRHLPPAYTSRSHDYIDGYNQGYESRMNQRKDSAFLFGFLTGLVIVAVGVAIVVANEEQQDRVETGAGNHMTAGKRRGATLFEF